MNEMARVKREIEALVRAVNSDLRPNSKSVIPPNERRALRSEIEICVRELDELRNKLTG
jgi:hypothetical protein